MNKDDIYKIIRRLAKQDETMVLFLNNLDSHPKQKDSYLSTMEKMGFTTPNEVRNYIKG